VHPLWLGGVQTEVAVMVAVETARAAGEMAASAGEMAAAVGRVEVAGNVTVRRCTGLQERRAGTYSPEDYGGAIAPPIERVRMSLRTG